MNPTYLDAGAFRDFVEVLENQHSADGRGGFDENWVSTANIWARILPSNAQSNQLADQRVVVKTHLIDVRQPLAIKAGFRLRDNNALRTFEVLSVTDPDETARYWRCACVEINP